MNTKWLVIGILPAMVGLTGCGALGPKFKPTQIEPGKGIIYIYRPGQPYPADAMPYVVMIDEQDVGVLKNKGYLFKQVAPGRHIVSSTGNSPERGDRIYSLTLIIEAGQSYYIKLQDLYPFHDFWESKLEFMSPSQAQVEIDKTKYSGK